MIGGPTTNLDFKIVLVSSTLLPDSGLTILRPLIIFDQMTRLPDGIQPKTIPARIRIFSVQGDRQR